MRAKATEARGPVSLAELGRQWRAMSTEQKNGYCIVLDQGMHVQQQQQLPPEVMPSDTPYGLGDCDFPVAPERLRPIVTGARAQNKYIG